MEVWYNLAMKLQRKPSSPSPLSALSAVVDFVYIHPDLSFLLHFRFKILLCVWVSCLQICEYTTRM